YLPLPWTLKKINLLLGSYLFYAAWNPPFVLLLWLCTLIDYFAGGALYDLQDKRRRKLLLALSLAANLGILSYFKYGGFLLDNFVVLAHSLGFDFHPARPNIILPAGISFYTFTSLSYTIDMYKRKSAPVRSLLDFSLFVSFFPHLVAGPIVRPPQLAPQFATPKQATAAQFRYGLLLFTIGLFMKVFLADVMLAPAADAVFNHAAALRTQDAWTGLLAFTGQIYFDFAGYSACAIGVAACFGFILPENFSFPYAAASFTGFWRRWHITLSAWLRDYLYIPLGGNRHGRWQTCRNILITMLLGGLWHGASWTFVAWGALHGLYLCAERFFGCDRNTANESLSPALIIRGLLVFFAVALAWVFFRAGNFGTAAAVFRALAGQSGAATGLLDSTLVTRVLLVAGGMLLVQWSFRDRDIPSLILKSPRWLLPIIWASIAWLAILGSQNSRSFIYFQF
ncbi:MAG: MBOAT family protein, partial [Bacteroidetes bacterium]|nr:MBOAT family protein [Bacteroidota bacterium]